MRPWSSTRICAAFITVDRRCAMMSVVRPTAACSSSAWIAFSVFESSAEVASSNTRMGGFFKSARAIATRCFSPPESLSPRSPTWVSYLSGSRSTKSWMWAARAAAMTSSRPASGRPYWML